MFQGRVQGVACVSVGRGRTTHQGGAFRNVVSVSQLFLHGTRRLPDCSTGSSVSNQSLVISLTQIDLSWPMERTYLEVS